MLTDGQTDGRTEWGIAIALSQIGWRWAKNTRPPVNALEMHTLFPYSYNLENVIDQNESLTFHIYNPSL